MSVYASVSDTVARRRAQQRAELRPPGQPGAPAAAPPMAEPTEAGGLAVAAPPAPPIAATSEVEGENVPASALAVITKYLPTEVIGTYLAVIAIIPAQRSHVPQWIAFWFFWLMTPVVVWLGVALKQGYLDLAPTSWPLWPMSAATLSFIAWAAVITNSAMAYLPWFQPYRRTGHCSPGLSPACGRGIHTAETETRFLDIVELRSLVGRDS